jgi:uncharacterized membrane protein YfhO
MIKGGRVDLYRKVLIEEDPPEEFKTLLSEPSEQVKYDINIVNYDIEHGNVELTANLQSPGFLVFSENYHPQWKCFVDNNETRIFQANFLFKGIFLEAGEHNIKFEFRNS